MAQVLLDYLGVHPSPEQVRSVTMPQIVKSYVGYLSPLTDPAEASRAPHRIDLVKLSIFIISKRTSLRPSRKARYLRVFNASRLQSEDLR